MFPVPSSSHYAQSMLCSVGSPKAFFGVHGLEAKTFFLDCSSHSKRCSSLFRVEAFQTQQPSNLSLNQVWIFLYPPASQGLLSPSPPRAPSIQCILRLSPPAALTIPLCAEPESSSCTQQPVCAEWLSSKVSYQTFWGILQHSLAKIMPVWLDDCLHTHIEGRRGAWDSHPSVKLLSTSSCTELCFDCLWPEEEHIKELEYTKTSAD